MFEEWWIYINASLDCWSIHEDEHNPYTVSEFDLHLKYLNIFKKFLKKFLTNEYLSYDYSNKL